MSKVHDALPLHTILLFLVVVEREMRGQKVVQSHLVELLGRKPHEISRDIGILADFSRAKDGGGLELVESVIDSNDRRQRLVRLTQKGRRLAEEMLGDGMAPEAAEVADRPIAA